MSRFAAIDLAKLPAPDVVETIDYEAVLAEMITDLTARDPAFSGLVESDPAIKILEVAAYRETLLRQRINEAARATMLAYAGGADLDNLAALLGVARAVLDPGDPEAVPPVAPTYEGDDRLRARAQLALEGFSTAGPAGAYLFHALAASPKAKDVAVSSPAPGDVLVSVLSTDGDGTAAEREAVTEAEVTLSGGKAVLEGRGITALVVRSADGTQVYAAGADYAFEATSSTLYRIAGGALPADGRLRVSYERADVLGLVRAALADEDVRPLTDRVTVQSAAIEAYAVEATLTLYDGPDAFVVTEAARAAAAAYVDARHRMGDTVTISGLHAALTVPGVRKVALASPAADVVTAETVAPYCTAITLAMAGA